MGLVALCLLMAAMQADQGPFLKRLVYVAPHVRPVKWKQQLLNSVSLIAWRRAVCILKFQLIISHYALGNHGCCDWAAGVQKWYAHYNLGMGSPHSGGHVRNVDHLAYRKAMLAWDTLFGRGCTVFPW